MAYITIYDVLVAAIQEFYLRTYCFLENQCSNVCSFWSVMIPHKFNLSFYVQDNVKDVSFAKLRRWWKGVNIFQKAYIFIPIHEE